MATAYVVPQGREMGAFLDRQAIGAIDVKRWDGHSKSCGAWDCLRRDPELSTRDSNCIVHLHAKGASRRGPSFMLPYSKLIEKECFPLIARFLSPDGPTPKLSRDIKQLERLATVEHPIELYVAPQALATKEQTFQYHIATRNFFAWVCGQPLVGVHLGQAMIGLLNSMFEFRSGLGDNVEDILVYMEEQGYMDITGCPDHAMAVAYFAEHFQMRPLYVRAMTHCVGMSDRLHRNSEYLYMPLITRKLIKTLRAELDGRVTRATEMLRNFLDDQLSETYLGLTSGCRAHLERFRSFLKAHYTTQLGFYPPRCFDSNLFRMMREDFEALYELLVDRGYTTGSSDSLSPMDVGGICTLQLVQALDDTLRNESLEHPLPLLPHVAEPTQLNRRTSWMSLSTASRGRAKPKPQLLTQTALIKATNWKADSFQNEIIRAYMRFEEETISAPIYSKTEKVSLADARKVRWLLIYGIYQTLLTVTEEPAEVNDDMDASYHLSADSDLLPRWKKKHELGFLIRSQTDMVLGDDDARSSAASAVTDTSSMGRIEIKPDIDYYALTHMNSPTSSTSDSCFWADSDSRSSGTAAGGRSNSLTRALRLPKSIGLRRSMMFFSKSNPQSPTMNPQASESTSTLRAFQDRVVQACGGGTKRANSFVHRNYESEEIDAYRYDDGEPTPVAEPTMPVWASRSASTASKPDSQVESVFESADDEASISYSSASSIGTSSPTTKFCEMLESLGPAAPAPLEPIPKKSPLRPASMVFESSDKTAVKAVPSSTPMITVSSPRAETKRFSIPRSRSAASFLQRTTSMKGRLADIRVQRGMSTREAGDSDDDACPPPILRARSTQQLRSGRRGFDSDEEDDGAEWASMQNWLDDDEEERYETWGQGSKGDAWGQYTELGGLMVPR